MKWLSAIAVLCSLAARGEVNSLNPAVEKIVDSVSEKRITDILKKLESFQNRNIFSDQDNPTHGIGAARKWIFEQFQSYSPRLQVRYDVHHIKKNNARIVRDVDIYNVVAVLPGKVHPERQFLVSGHYDSVIFPPPPEGSDNDEPRKMDPNLSEPLAPGVTDDASGVAAVMELARIMSEYEFANTIVFVAFAAEEEGLVGSRAYAREAERSGQIIDGVLNNDIIGSDIAGNGRKNNGTVWCFSDEPADSASRELARYIRAVSGRYVPSMRVDLVFRRDRFQRGGDHTSFHAAGFAAVRFTSPAENFENQHSVTDTFANTSPSYVTSVARVNAAALASLALAPKAPVVTRDVTKGPNAGRKALLIDRGKSRYDAHLRWRNDRPEPDLAGYAVVTRATTSPYWDREVFVGNVNEYTFKNVSIDDAVFGVKAVDKAGDESLVSAYEIYPPRPDLPKRKDGMKAPDEIVQEQLDAFNALDIDALLKFYAPDAQVIEQQTGRPLASGAAQLRQRFAARFRGAPELQATVVDRTTLGDYVIDREKITGASDGKTVEDVLIYEVKDGLIRRVWALE